MGRTVSCSLSAEIIRFRHFFCHGETQNYVEGDGGLGITIIFHRKRFLKIPMVEAKWFQLSLLNNMVGVDKFPRSDF